MGCASSKQVKGSVEVYRPAPTSFAVFDIHAIEEPWLIKTDQPLLDDDTTQFQKPTTIILDKLDPDADADTVADAPRSWDEVSKSLQTHLKPLNNPQFVSDKVQPPAHLPNTPPPPRKNLSFHTLEEIEAKKLQTHQVGTKNTNNPTLAEVRLRKTESARTESLTESSNSITSGYRSVKENIFIVKDKLEREKEGKKKPEMKWDPLSEFPERCPPGGADAVVFYTTSLRGIRRTYEDCIAMRLLLEQQGVVFDERDVSLHPGYLSELKDLIGTETMEGVGVAPPRLFIKGRYVGGAEQVVGLNEQGRLGRIMRWARVDRVGEDGRHTCESCGEVKWLPCLDCGGSCKIPAGVGGWERCGMCNENGLVRCPTCATLK